MTTRAVRSVPRVAGMVVAVAACLADVGVCSSTHPGSKSDASANAGGNANDASGGAAATSGSPAGAGGTTDAAVEHGPADARVAEGGGADGAPTTDGATETRLVPWQLEATGSNPLVMGIFDTRQKAVCAFVPDQTGQLRCVPPAPASLNGGGVFMDAACTKPVYQVWAAELASVPKGQIMALPLPRQGCAPIQYFAGTLSVVPSDGPEWVGTATTCTSTDPEFVSTGFETVVAAATPIDIWATGTAVDGPIVDDRLQVAQVATADGARFDDHVVDTRWGKPCDLKVAAGVCRPTILPAYGGFFTDDQCMGQAVVPESVCDAAFIGTSPYRAIGAPWTGPVFENDPAPCQPVTASTFGSSTFFTYGAAFDGDAIMSVGWVAKGTGRLRLRELVGKVGPSAPVANALTWHVDGAAATFVPRFHDTSAAEDCDPVWAPDGLVRCVPTSVARAYGGIFADASCKTPGYLCYDADCPSIVMMDMGGDSTHGYHAVGVHPLVSVQTIYTSTNGTCSSFLSGTTFEFGAGKGLPWDTFPRLTEVNAP